MRLTLRTALTIAASAGFLIVGSLQAAPATAAPTAGDSNHGSCVSSSDKPSGQGGRSAVAKDKNSCPAPPAPLTCAVTGNVVKDSAADTVRVSGYDNPNNEPGNYDGSSLECATSIPVTANESTVVFTYVLGANTAPCGGGVPRVFVVIDGAYYNTIDGDPECSQQTGKTVTYTIPVTGTVTSVGLVYDRDVDGSVTYSDVSVGGQALDF